MDARSIILFQSFKLHLQMNTLGNEQDGCKTLEYAWPFPKVKLKSEHGSAMECMHCCGRSMCRFFSKRSSDIYTAIPTKATLLYRQAAPCEACSVQIKAGAVWCVTGWQGWQGWQAGLKFALIFLEPAKLQSSVKFFRCSSVFWFIYHFGSKLERT